MLKHATITRTSRVQQELQKHWDQQMREQQQTEQMSCDDPMNTLRSNHSFAGANASDINADLSDILPSPSWLSGGLTTTAMASRGLGQLVGSCNPSPSPKSTPTSKFSISSAPSSVFSSPSKTYPNGITSDNTLSSINGFSRSSSNTNMDTSKTHISAPLTTTTSAAAASSKCGSESMIKVFAQTLSQEVEYVTLHVNAQTKSQQIIRSLLKKFRLKHRDPNLFYLTLERWIRKDGLKQKSVMLLSDEACPLQLQQCCSNPPHNDIKFTLQMRAGALMKIYCSDVCPNTRYKCLSLSTQTSVDETIELMLHCLNLIGAGANTSSTTTTTTTASITPTTTKSGGNQSLTSHYNNNASRMRLAAGSPSLTDSSSTSSASSTTSSSSGIESDPMLANNQTHHQQSPYTGRLLDSSSRTNSVTSISSCSNVSNTSSSHLGEQYCLIIECRDTNYRRILESDEYLVDVYQSLLDEAREKDTSPATPLQTDSNGNFNLSPKSPLQSISQLENTINKQKPDQWFFIKLKRREEVVVPSIKSTTPRQNMPLPPIPLSLTQFNNSDHLQSIVSTTQIEVNNNNHRSFQQHHRQTISLTGSLARTKTRPESATSNNNAHDMVDGNFPPASTIMTHNNNNNNNNSLPHYRQMSAIVGSQNNAVDKQQTGDSSMPPPPASLIWLPPVRPRRRDLSNASTSTFGRPQSGGGGGISISHQLNNRRRYDPAQLAQDLDRLDLSDNLIPTTTMMNNSIVPLPQPPTIAASPPDVGDKLNADPSVVVSLNNSDITNNDDLLINVTEQSDNNSNSNQLVVLVEPPLEEVTGESAQLAPSVAITTATDQLEP